MNNKTLDMHYKDVIETIEIKLYSLTGDNALSGFIVYLFHTLICGIPLLYMVLGEVNYIFFACVFFWFFIFRLHFYFKGCILVKAERHLWNSKDWLGPWMLLFRPLNYFLDTEISKETSEKIFIAYGVMLVLFIVNKIRNSFKK